MQSELTEKLRKYGTDIEEISKRFCENIELYENCFWRFVSDENIKLLTDAYDNQDNENFFTQAHTMKGLSGNLGLTHVYKALCILVQVIKEKKNDLVYDEYMNVLKQIEILKSFVAPNN